MCSIVILRNPDHPRWPLLIGANRDEIENRPSQAPGRHWSDRPDIIAGLDELAGGSWLGTNDTGVVAAILNRKGSLGPAPGKRSRGELVLDALDYADAVDAVESFRFLATESYRPFNLLVADNRDAFWLSSAGSGALRVGEIPPGLHMLTAHDLDDSTDPRIARFLPRFRAADVPDPDRDTWQAWQELLASGAEDASLAPEAGMCFKRDDGFGTRSSALIALPTIHRLGEKPVWRFAPGPPATTPYAPLDRAPIGR